MKNFKTLSLVCLTFLLFAACSDDDTPEVVIEEEVITTLTVTLSPSSGGDDVILKSQDLDGDGPDAPVVTVSGDFAAGTSYSGSIELLNETEEHQFFYTVATGLNITTTYSNFDEDGNPLGTEFELVTGDESSGNFTFTLRHEPTKPNSGLADAGGETDISVTFSVAIQDPIK